MENNTEDRSPIFISIGFIFLLLVAWLVSFLITTFIFTISFFETYGILMLGIALTVIAREFVRDFKSKW
jgi:hypothetical protein